jgi:hypothetical protein
MNLNSEMGINDLQILDKITFNLDEALLYKKLRIERNSEHANDLQEMIAFVAPLIKPKAIFKVCDVVINEDNGVKLGGVEFLSRILRENLHEVDEVFAFIATCGNELENSNIAENDMLKMFCLDTIKEMALETSADFLKTIIKKEYNLEKLPSMSPGSGAGNIWPIEQQKQLFSLFGDTEELIGVRLTESCLMIPNKSVSGICYAKGKEFISCQLCDRENCEKRRAPFNATLKEEYAV